MCPVHEFPADTKALASTSLLVADACEQLGFSEQLTGDILISVDELVTNTIMQGLKYDATKTFQFEVTSFEDQIEIVIREKGEAFDPAEVAIPDTLASLEDRPIGGLGIFFIRKLMDQFSYTVSNDGEKTFKMTKRKG